MNYTIIQSIGYLTLFYADGNRSKIYYSDSRLGLNHGPFTSSNAAVEHWTKLTHPMIKEYNTNKPASSGDSTIPEYALPELGFTDPVEDNKVVHVDFINKVRIK